MRYFTTIVFAVLSVTTWALLRFGVRPQPPVTVTENAAITDYQKQGLETATEMNKLVITLATVVLAAAAKLVMTASGEGIPLLDARSFPVRILVSMAVLLAVASLYLSYFIYDKLVEMMAAGFLDLNSDTVLLPRELQVDCLMLSVFLLGFVVIRSLDARA